MTRSDLRLRPRQQGMALITGLLLLVVCTLIGLSMFRSYGMQEKIAGNIREKQRATNAANSTLQYAEWWLTNNALPVAANCSGTASATVQICTNALTDPTSWPWAGGVTFTGFNTSNTVSSTASRGTYYNTPVFYITDLGANKGTPAGEVYQIDAIAWGSTANTVAVVESTYLLTSSGGGPGPGPSGK